VTTTYFAEGFPYMIVRWLSGIYFTDIGMKEAVIGYLNWFGIPWNFKWVWAPLVDLTSSRRQWLVRIELALAVLMGVLALFVSYGPKGQGAASQPVERLEWGDLANAIDPTLGFSHQTIVIGIIFAFIALATVAATHDVAIDAFYIEGLPVRRDQAAYSGLRVMAYRGAVLFVKFALVVATNWAFNFIAAAVVMFFLFAFHAVYLPRFPSDVAKERKGPLLGEFGKAFSSYLQQPRIGVILAFIVTYKLGDELLFAMNSTFLMRELLVTKAQMSWLSGVIGTGTTIFGTLVGAYWIQRSGFQKAFWPITLMMNLNIWVYVWLAWAKPQATVFGDFTIIGILHGYEQFAAGLGNAALTVFLLYTCKPEYKAAHYAIGSAIMSVGATFIGGFTGLIVEKIGYTNLFIISFFATLPSMLLMFRLPLEEMLREKDA